LATRSTLTSVAPRAATPRLLELYAGRLRFAGALLGLVLAAGLLLRIVLWIAFREPRLELGTLGQCLGMGFLRDALAALVLLTPLFLALALLRLRWLARPGLRRAALALFVSAVVFEGLVEYFYFEEFDARFNNIAVDYLLYPGEVAGNLWESYDVPLHLFAALVAGLATAWLVARALGELSFEPAPIRARLRAGLMVLATSAAAVAGSWWLPRATGSERVAEEIARNGPAELVRAAWSADLEYPLYYRTLPASEEGPRAARVLGFPAAEGGSPALQKHFCAAGSRPAPHQIVIVLEESLGSDFVAALGGRSDSTPELERHFADGLLLTNLVANGNRTVRGLEGVLCSFVPLPGYAILRRGKSENVATIARVVKARGYDTAFFYGGSGAFDGIEPFVRANGWDEFHSESEYPEDTFRTAWGVADEYVFDALLARQEQARARGEPLLATMLSVSNHKPYDFPRGRYPLPAELHGRQGAVRYADACIGGYLDQLHARGLDEDTLVLIVGDHGARVYGAEEIPTQSYRIPALFVTSDPRWRGQRAERLCSQIDLVPTLLELAGIDCTAPFLGTSVLARPSMGGRAFVQHNRDVGILTDDALVVLGLQKAVSFYTRPGPASDAFTPIDLTAATPELWALADDASAVFGRAYGLYEQRAYRLPSEPRVADTTHPSHAP
jgi:phosphoglycerol transferase MdoB-like AlkP superfamily enzyme